MVRMSEYDVLVVGGGINGAGIARDAAGRGLSVILCEKDDLAAHTSSASSKLIHGGLRYLEYYEFGLVRKALQEREVLLKSAPHIMWPLRFVMPHDQGMRPAWMIRAGLFLYDRLARREFLPGSHGVDLRAHPAGAALREQYRQGFEYSDAWVDDARLVALAALDAGERGARILTRTRCIKVERHEARWNAWLQHADGRGETVSARCLVNAAGPWAGEFLHAATGAPAARALRLIKGSHIIVPRLFDHAYAYIFQHTDQRIVFALPYQKDFTLIGTTDVDFAGDPDRVAISAEEVAYLCGIANRYFHQRITPMQVLHSYAGIRPIVEDDAATAAAATRDFRFEHDTEGAPLLTVFGGKITTFRKLAEQAVDWIAPALGSAARGWTAHAVLPGGDLFGAEPCKRAVVDYAQWQLGIQRRYGWLSQQLVARYCRAYGSRVTTLLAGCRSAAEMGPEVLPGLFGIEIHYLMTQEFARTAEDILWRRTKLGLHLPAGAAATLDAWLSRLPAH
jgi:glycerol-3-phosphate dehydrogenase